MCSVRVVDVDADADSPEFVVCCCSGDDDCPCTPC